MPTGVVSDAEAGGEAGGLSKVISEHIRVFCRQKPELPEDSTTDEHESVYVTGDGGDRTPSSQQPCVTWDYQAGACSYQNKLSKSEQR
jgi:hypothetical protein